LIGYDSVIMGAAIEEINIQPLAKAAGVFCILAAVIIVLIVIKSNIYLRIIIFAILFFIGLALIEYGRSKRKRSFKGTSNEGDIESFPMS